MTSQKLYRELGGCLFPAQPQAKTSSCSQPVPHLPALELAMPGGCLTPPVPHPACPHPLQSTEQCQHPHFTSCVLPLPCPPCGPGAAACARRATRAHGGTWGTRPCPSPGSLSCTQLPPGTAPSLLPSTPGVDDEQSPLHTGCWGL